MKAALFTIVYAGIEPYWADFCAGYRGQQMQVPLYIGVEPGAQITHVPDGSQVVSVDAGLVGNRCAVFERMRADGIDYLIGIDADDVLTPQRVAASVQALANAPDGIFGDVLPFQYNDGFATAQNPRLAASLTDGQAVDFDDILDGNPIGFGALAMPVVGALACLRPFAHVDVPVCDWALASAWLQQGHTFHFCAAAQTAYRQHWHNTASAARTDVAQLLQVRLAHHRLFAAHPAHQRRVHACESLLSQSPLPAMPVQPKGWWWEADVCAMHQPTGISS